MQYKKIFMALQPLDIVITAFYFLTSLAFLTAGRTVPYWYVYIVLNIFTISGIYFLAYRDCYFSTWNVKMLRYWILAPFILYTFKQIYFLIKPVRGTADYDFILINADKFIFGGSPTVFLGRFANPALTEILQLAYTSFYYLPMFLAISLYKQKNYNAVEYSLYSVILGFFISYIAYFIYPAIGPRFTLHNFANTDAELPGIFLTKYIRLILNLGESVPLGASNPEVFVQRDVFPSGHTMMTAMVMYLSVKFKSGNKIFLLITGSLLIFSTVYLRYHYAIDVLAGIVFMVISLWFGNILYKYLNKFLQKVSQW